MLYGKLNLRNIYVILLLFVIVSFLRSPQTNRPLSYHHEFCTAVALRVMDIWWEEGIGNFHFSPVMTYPGEANKNINNHATGSMQMIDSEDNYYYVSHPPLAYYLPYVLFSLLHIQPSVFGLQFFQWLVHLLCGIMLFAGAKVVAKQFNFRASSLFPYAVLITYLLNPSTLWFQGNVYMSDTLVQVFVIAGMLLWWRQLHGENPLQSKTAIPLMLAAGFAGGFTSWYAYIFFGTLLLLSVFYTNKKPALKLALAGLAGVFLGLICTILIYSQINGFEALMQEYSQRFGQRGMTNWSLNKFFSTLKLWGFNYAANYLPYLIFMLIALVIVFKDLKQQLTKKIVLYFAVPFFPLVLLHIVLPNYVGHDFTTLYAAPFVAVFGAYLWMLVVEKYRTKSLVYIPGLAVVFAGVLQFNFINFPGEYSIRKKPYDVYEKGGNYINHFANQDEVVFLKTAEAEPQLIYYAKRNIRTISQEEDAIQFLNTYNQPKGRIFYADERGYVYEHREIE